MDEIVLKDDSFVFEDATRDRTVSNIANQLGETISKKYNIKDKAVIENILKVHGIHPDNFDAVGMMSKFINGRLNDNSIDSNANKGSKTISVLSSETSAPKDKAVGYDYLYQEMKSIFGKDEAKRLSGEMYDYSLALSDSSKILMNYCFSVDLSRLITEGRPFGQLPSLPCKSIRSYIGSACETLHQLSQHLAGAVAASTLFFDIAHLCLYKHKLDIRELKTNKWFRKEIENTFQHFVHSMNMLSRDAAQSPFTNISINDKVKIRKVVLEMSHMFPLDQLPISKPIGLFTEEEEKEFYLNYIVDYIDDIQNIFLDFFDKGAPSLNGANYRFPVTTLALSKHRNKKTCEWEITDKSFLRSVCKRQIERYNIFSSEGTKFASCCFIPSQKVFFKFNGEKTEIRFDKLFERTRFPEEYIKEKGLYQKEIDEGEEIVAYCDGEEIKANVICLDYDDVLYEIKLENGITLSTTKDHYNVVWFNDDFCIDVKSEFLFVGNEILMRGGKHSKIVEINKRWYNGKVYCLKTKTEEERFDIPGDIITHNCRLINDTELMTDYASQANSFGAGGSVSVGSHRVCTINLPRLSYEATSMRDFFKRLDARLEDTAKILKAHKSLLKRLTDAGLQEFISNGYIKFDRLFSTFGIIGTYECGKNLTERFGEIEGKIMLYILQFINSKVSEYSKKYGIAGNIEQIPGESMASRLAKVDKMIFGEDVVKTKMYSNQHWPLWLEASIWERLGMDGECNSYISGGGIAHATLGERLTSKQNEQIIMYAVKCGCEHFALNPFYSKCEDSHIEFGRSKTCPKCGKNVVDYMTRIIGYFICVSDADEARREEIMSRPDTKF